MPARILSRCRLTPLALLIGTAFALSQPVHAKTLHVTTCADNGSNGSLRSVIARAQDGDTVDLTTLQCAVITEGSGPFVINQNHLTIRGVGPKTVINGYPAQGPIFAHTGNGRLTLEYLSLQNGLKYVTGPDDALGGCVFSSSDVELFDVQLSRCEAVYSSTKHAGNAKGGAIYAVGDVTLVESTITYGDAFVDFGTHALSGAASGGAIYAGGGLLMRDSQIIASETRATGSHARSFGGAVQAASVSCKYSTISRGGASNSRGDAYGGGIATTGNAYLLDDAIDDNKADEGAGLDFRGAGSSAEILQSTIASNTAYHAGGGIATRAGLTVTSSTIAYNRSMVSANGGGIAFIGSNALDLESALVANNRSATDVDIASLSGTIVATGANNLVRSTRNITLPAGTVTGDPRLRNFGDHGGPTATFSLYSDSPAINAGNNVANQQYDQRGPGYPRVLLGAPDIGAFESVYSPP